VMDINSISVTATVVPEPTSTVAIVSSVGMAALMLRRRRARQAE
jgi:hypothetical protein